jgi:hypothetical protein
MTVRYVPQRDFPAYGFVPGNTPHPTRDPRGHSFGVVEAEPPYLDATQWAVNEPYLWGVDLFNHGYPWEAHEVWEGLWRVCRRRGDDPQAALLQALIQCAAAQIKVATEQPRAGARLLHKALARMRAVGCILPHFMGLDIPAHYADMLHFLDREGAPWPLIELGEEQRPRRSRGASASGSLRPRRGRRGAAS